MRALIFILVGLFVLALAMPVLATNPDVAAAAGTLHKYSTTDPRTTVKDAICAADMPRYEKVVCSPSPQVMDVPDGTVINVLALNGGTEEELEEAAGGIRPVFPSGVIMRVGTPTQWVPGEMVIKLRIGKDEGSTSSHSDDNGNYSSGYNANNGNGYWGSGGYSDSVSNTGQSAYYRLAGNIYRVADCKGTLDLITPVLRAARSDEVPTSRDESGSQYQNLNQNWGGGNNSAYQNRSVSESHGWSKPTNVESAQMADRNEGRNAIEFGANVANAVMIANQKATIGEIIAKAPPLSTPTCPPLSTTTPACPTPTSAPPAPQPQDNTVRMELPPDIVIN